MTTLGTGVQGAKVASWNESGPRALLKRLMENHPEADKDTLFAAFLEYILSKDGEKYRAAIIQYWFANNYISLTAPSTSPVERESRQRRSHATVEAVKSKITARIQEQAQILLLDMILANGKPLRDCTGKECRRLAVQMGAWLTNIANTVKANQRVGDVLSEDRVREMYERC